MTRIAIIDPNKCKPEKCSKECIGIKQDFETKSQPLVHSL